MNFIKFIINGDPAIYATCKISRNKIPFKYSTSIFFNMSSQSTRVRQGQDEPYTATCGQFEKCIHVWKQL